MRIFLIIPAAFLVYFLVGPGSCGSDEMQESGREEAELYRTRDSIRNEFTADELTQQHVRAFEEKAKQILVDFSDYFNIYSDTSYDKTFRDHSLQMIFELFLSDSSTLNLLPPGQGTEEGLRLTAFFDSGIVFQNHYHRFIFDSIRISDSLQRTDSLRYSGNLVFSQQTDSFIAPDSVAVFYSDRKAEIIVAKVMRPFGSDTLQVWRVFLGDIH